MMNLLEVLKVLNQGENYFVKVDNYENIGCEVVDNFNLFQRGNVAVPTPFTLIGHDNRMNISVANKIYGQVKLNPIQAKKVGLPPIIKGPVTYNTKTIIRDGILNVKNMDLIIDNKTYMTLLNNNVEFTEKDNDTLYPGYIINIDLTKLPFDNIKSNFTMDEIQSNMEKINELKAKQKILNALISQIPKIEHESFGNFTPEQSNLLKEHGLNENLQYVGIDNETIKTSEYTSQIIDFKLKGSTMNSLPNLLKRVQDGKKLNNLDTIQYNYYNELNNSLNQLQLSNEEKLNFLNDKLSPIKSELAKLRLRNVIIKLDLNNSPVKEMALESDSEFSYNKTLKIQFSSKSFNK